MCFSNLSYVTFSETFENEVRRELYYSCHLFLILFISLNILIVYNCVGKIPVVKFYYKCEGRTNTRSTKFWYFI